MQRPHQGIIKHNIDGRVKNQEVCHMLNMFYSVHFVLFCLHNPLHSVDLDVEIAL